MTGSIYIFQFRQVPKNSRYVALIPFLFGIQQMLEGVVWLGIDGAIPNGFQIKATYIFAAFALIIWPTYFPFSMFYYEPNQKLRKITLLFLLAGLAVSLTSSWFILTHNLDSYVSCEHLKCSSVIYQIKGDFIQNDHLLILYNMCLIAPFFITTNKVIRNCFAPAYLLSIPFSQMIVDHIQEFSSVWCFIAAMLSIILVFSFNKKQLSG